MIERLQLPPLGAPPLEVGPNELDLVGAWSTSSEEMQTFHEGVRQGRFVLVEHNTNALPCLRPKHLGSEALAGLSPADFQELQLLQKRGRVVVSDDPEPFADPPPDQGKVERGFLRLVLTPDDRTRWVSRNSLPVGSIDITPIEPADRVRAIHDHGLALRKHLERRQAELGGRG